MSVQVFMPEVTSNYEWIQPLESDDLEKLTLLDGRPLGANWSPISVSLLRDDGYGNAFKEADAPWLGRHALVFCDDAYLRASELLGGSGEFLELITTDSNRYWLFNALNVVEDGLDEAASDIRRYPSTGRVMRVERYAFNPKAIEGLEAFKVPQDRTLFLSAQTVEALLAMDLDGLQFEVAWQIH